MKVSVIGLGYMGLPMASVLAEAGHEVVGVDINPRVVEAVNKGTCPFTEPGMPELVQRAHETGRLRAVLAPEAAEVFLLSLPTPVNHHDHTPDMSLVEAGAASIAKVLKAGDLVILESTSPVGATRKNCKDVIEKLRPDLKDAVGYVFCPERAIPGATLKEMVGNDRLVGELTPGAGAKAAALYRTFCKGEVIETTAEEAEMTKLVENASRDAQIAFANELSMVCDALGLDVWRIRELANRHPRVNIMMPASGVGGHCIAVDPWFIIHSAPEVTPLMRVVRDVNDAKPLWVAEKVREAVKRVQAGGKRDVVVACLGLAYKPDVDDLRESPAIAVVDALAKDAGLRLLVVEPFIDHYSMPLTSLDNALKEADILVSLTGHSVFKTIDRAVLDSKVLVDACGVWK